MGSLRRGLILSALPMPALAEVCDKERPYWEPGSQATSLTEALHLFASPVGMSILVLFVLAMLFRRSWLLWACFAVSSLMLIALAINPAIPDPTGIRYFAVMEGCIGPQNLSFALLLFFVATSAFFARRIKRQALSG